MDNMLCLFINLTPTVGKISKELFNDIAKPISQLIDSFNLTPLWESIQR